MTVIINPGAGDVDTDLGFQQAYNNILKFIEDSEVPLFVEVANHIPEGGRYLFKLGTPLKNDMKWEIEMPSLPLEQVRYIDSEKQNIWDFPRLYVDGSSWVWKFAIIRKKHIIEHLQCQNEDYKSFIENNERIIQELEQSLKVTP